MNQFQHTKATVLTDFQPLQKIGEGSFSSVYRVRRLSDGKIYALKKIKISNLSQKQRNNALNEIRILASLQSPYIVQYRQAFFDQKLNLLCIVMDCANQGDLQKQITVFKNAEKRIEELQIWKAISHILEGLVILHSKNILHRDLKTANIFISDGIYKIGDLNVSKVQTGNRSLAYTQTGTPYYASPEIWRDEPYDSKSDIWSLGCIVYQMCAFNPPFHGNDLNSLFKSVQKGYYPPIPSQYSKTLTKFISYCLNKKSNQRSSAEQLLHKIVNKKCFQLNLKKSKQTYEPLKLLKTIKFPENYQNLNQFLPQSRYNQPMKIKNNTQETQEKSRSNRHYESNKSIANRYHKYHKELKYDISERNLQRLELKEKTSKKIVNYSHKLLPVLGPINKRSIKIGTQQRESGTIPIERQIFRDHYYLKMKRNVKRINSLQSILLKNNIKKASKQEQFQKPYSCLALPEQSQADQKVKPAKDQQEIYKSSPFLRIPNLKSEGALKSIESRSRRDLQIIKKQRRLFCGRV